MDASNTARQQPEGKPFVKGDPRINRKGRPKSFDALRELAQQIAHEVAKTKDGQPVVIAGRTVTNAELVLRRWIASPDARLQMHVMEVAFGKVPQTLEVSGPDGGAMQMQMRNFEAALDKVYGDAAVAPDSAPDAT
jgi:hypothetical protein